MGHTLTLNLPDNAWQDLLRASQDRNEPPEAVAEKLLSEAVSDPLMRLAGCLSMPFSDISERHDEYIGQSMYDEAERD